MAVLPVMFSLRLIMDGAANQRHSELSGDLIIIMDLINLGREHDFCPRTGLSEGTSQPILTQEQYTVTYRTGVVWKEIIVKGGVL